jgi:hypothetical protein
MRTTKRSSRTRKRLSRAARGGRRSQPDMNLIADDLVLPRVAGKMRRIDANARRLLPEFRTQALQDIVRDIL